MVSLDFLDEVNKEKIVSIWKTMTESDKAHFINQVALALSVWGSDDKGKKMVVEVLGLMTNNGTNTLADFGLYVDRTVEMQKADDRVKRAAIIIEGYRIKNALSSEPHRELDI